MPQQYPGQNTEFYIVINGVQTGPLTGLAQVASYNPTPDTPVWYEGLDDWTPAIMASLTRQLFDPASDYYRAQANPQPEPQIQPAPQQATQPAPQPATAHPYAAPAAAPAFAGVHKPKSYLGWSIAVTILFNFIAGIVAIVYSCKVNSRWNRGDAQGAVRASERVQWWIAISIVVGLVTSVAGLFVSPF